MKNKKQPIIMSILALVVIGGAFALLNRRDEPKGELGGVYRAEEIANLHAAKQMETVELIDDDTFDLTASFVKKNINGHSVRMLAYNGSIPGPLIKVKQGSEVTINFTNNTDVNSTIHSHGVRVENQFDGTPGLTQDPVKPGETFTYTLKFPDAGMFWYHPHVREDYAQELGLYGNFLIESDDPHYWNPVNREVPLFLDDILLENGLIARFDKETANHTLMGRFGNVMLVNGLPAEASAQAGETDYRMDAKQGEVVRFYLTNAANTRTFNIVIASGAKHNEGLPRRPDVVGTPRNDGIVKMKLVGGDNGKYERDIFVENVILSPSERAIVEVLFPQAGTYRLEHRTPGKTYPLATIAVSSEQISPSYASLFETVRTNQDTIASIDALRNDFIKPADKSLKLAVLMKSPMGMPSSSGQHMPAPYGTEGSRSGMHGGMMPVRRNFDEGGMNNSMMTMGTPQPIEWEDDMGMPAQYRPDNVGTGAGMNRDSTTETLTWQMTDEATGKSNMKIDDWKFKVGDRVKIKIFNDPKALHPMQHPIHIHGQRFLVLSTNDVAHDNLVWKDTALVKTGDTVEFLVEISNPGTWMIHCHIAEHLEADMMMKFEVT